MTLSLSDVKHFISTKLTVGQTFTVVFQKVDGSSRTMECQLTEPPVGATNDIPSPLPVMTPDGYRSFKLDSVISLELN